MNEASSDNILICGSSPELLCELEGIFAGEYIITPHERTLTALRDIAGAKRCYAAALYDISAPSADIGGFIRRLRNIGCARSLPVAAICADEGSKAAGEAVAAGAADVLCPSCGADILRRRLKNIVAAACAEEMRGKYHRERLMRDSMISDAVSFFEADITADRLITGDARLLSWAEEHSARSYGALMSVIAKTQLSEDDAKLWLSQLKRDKLLADFEGGRRGVTLEYCCMQGREDQMWVSASLHMIRDECSGHVLAICYVRNIDERKKSELALRCMAEHDPLTELYNRAAFELICERTLAQNRICGDTAAFYMIDVDNFKTINDSFGHDYGDDVLISIGAKLRSVFRSCDYVGRIGGDEYAVLIPRVVSRQVITRRAEDICRTLSLDVSNGGGTRRISCSVGVAFAPEHGADFRTLYKSADKALYEAKSLGKNCYTVYKQ